MIFAANSAFASRSSALGRFRSAKTFPELGVNSLLGIFPLLTFPPACAQGEAAVGSNPIPVAGSQLQMLPSSGRHEERRSLPRVELRTPRDTSRSDRRRAPAIPLPQSHATSSRSHVSDRSAPDTVRNRACAEPRAGSLSAERASRQAKSPFAVVPVSRPQSPLYARTSIKWSSKTVAPTVAARKVSPHEPRNELKMKRIPLHRSMNPRPVTSEVAGSSPVVPATPFSHCPSPASASRSEEHTS